MRVGRVFFFAGSCDLCVGFGFYCGERSQEIYGVFAEELLEFLAGVEALFD
jgi:hypothetical protein